MLRTATDLSALPEDPFIPQHMVRQWGLRPGQQVTGQMRPPEGGKRTSPTLTTIETIEGLPPDEAKTIPAFEDLEAEIPFERLVLEKGKDDIIGRCIDLLAPIGKGTRGLIVAPPFAGKTRILSSLAESFVTKHPDLEVFILLVDERPEEVTAFRRAGHGTVVASSFDSKASEHIRLARLLMHRSQRLIEIGKDVVILLDSLTRLTRANNLAQKGSGRTMTGGLDPAALRFPRQLFGAARATREGSLTILATALINTESRMDDHIYEEFKGTGNWELVLNRKLAEQRLYPAIDVNASGTRREELLYTEEELIAVHRLRRYLRSQTPDPEEALQLIFKWMQQFPSNEQLCQVAARLQGR